MPTPLYTPLSCSSPAYQLNWSYALFWHSPTADASWLKPVSTVLEADDIRILQHHFAQPTTSQFLVSTRPSVSPKIIAQRIKSRLQHLVRDTTPNAFARNYSLRSIGTTTREVVDNYLATQIDHHPITNPTLRELFQRFQFHDTTVDLSVPSRTSHAIYWYNLHVVLVHDERYHDVNEERLRAKSAMLINSAKHKGHWLSRAAHLPDHIHFTLRGGLAESPEDIVLSYMNNLAFAVGMKSIFRNSYYVGTFSEYDVRMI